MWCRIVSIDKGVKDGKAKFMQVRGIPSKYWVSPFKQLFSCMSSISIVHDKSEKKNTNWHKLSFRRTIKNNHGAG